MDYTHIDSKSRMRTASDALRVRTTQCGAKHKSKQQCDTHTSTTQQYYAMLVTITNHTHTCTALTCKRCAHTTFNVTNTNFYHCIALIYLQTHHRLLLMIMNKAHMCTLTMKQGGASVLRVNSLLNTAF
jgi:hypothetical protein